MEKMEIHFNKICTSIETMENAKQTEAIEAMIKTFGKKFGQPAHEYAYILVGCLLMANTLKFDK